jgi:DNA-binding transcriptional MerR regulator
MAWSTRQIAELAGTTVKTVRHYHQIGLLAEPNRASNGYKQYEVRHLVSLLRIIRLTELQVPLVQIAEMESSEFASDDSLKSLDGELGEHITHLNHVRAELALIFRRQSSTDMPEGLGPLIEGMSESDRALLLVYSRIFGLSELRDLRENLLELMTTAEHSHFDLLPPDAGEETRELLANAYAIRYQSIAGRFPWMTGSKSRALRGRAFETRTIAQALRDIYNPAQLDVLERVKRIVRESPTR